MRSIKHHSSKVTQRATFASGFKLIFLTVVGLTFISLLVTSSKFCPLKYRNQKLWRQYIKISSMMATEKQLELAKLQLSYTKLIVPVSGAIATVNIEVNEKMGV